MNRQQEQQSSLLLAALKHLQPQKRINSPRRVQKGELATEANNETGVGVRFVVGVRASRATGSGVEVEVRTGAGAGVPPRVSVQVSEVYLPMLEYDRHKNLVLHA